MGSMFDIRLQHLRLCFCQLNPKLSPVPSEIHTLCPNFFQDFDLHRISQFKFKTSHAMAELLHHTHLLAFLPSHEAVHNTTLDLDQAISSANTTSSTALDTTVVKSVTSTDLQEYDDQTEQKLNWKFTSKTARLSVQVPALTMTGPNSIRGQQCVVM